MLLLLLLAVRAIAVLSQYQSKYTYSHDLKADCKWKDFEIIQLLGTGGHGEVFKGLHKPSGKKVALKVLSARESAADLEREETIQSRLRHPFISKHFCGTIVSESGDFKGRELIKGSPVFVLELVDGKSLREVMKGGTKISVKKTVKQLIEVLTFLRKELVVFGDLSSGNVMLTKDHTIKLVDFGAALDVYDDNAKEPEPVFVSYKTRPHRWRKYGADWYSLGLLMEEMLYYSENGHWRNQRTMKGRACKELVKDSEACEVIKYLLPVGGSFNSIWGTNDETLSKLLSLKWLA